MAHSASFARRALFTAAVLLAVTAAFGFAQSAPGNPSNAAPGHPSEPGVLVVSVQQDSPADKAGIARGDIILEINGSAVNTIRDVRQAVASHAQGDTITVKLRHGDAEKTASLTLTGSGGHPVMGVALLPDQSEWRGMRSAERDGLGGPSHGALVARVVSGGPADKAGLKKGDVILSVDGTAVDADHPLGVLIQGKKAGDTVTLSVEPRRAAAGKGPHDVTVTLGTSTDGKRPWLGVAYMAGTPLAGFMMPDDESVPGSSRPAAPGMTAPLQAPPSI